MAKTKKLEPAPEPAPPLRLDFGCGPHKRDGFLGVDAIAFDGVDHVLDLTVTPWPWADSSVDEAHASHFMEHLTGAQRVVFFNELYRVMKVGAQITVICPNWSHERAYGDPTHQWPPVSTWTFFYLEKQWRDANAPHCGYSCDFSHVVTGTINPQDPYVAFRNQETQWVLMYRSVNTTVDIHAVLTKQETPNG